MKLRVLISILFIISLGSLSELETQLIISEKLGYIKDHNSVSERVEILRRKLLNFIKYLKNSPIPK